MKRFAFVFGVVFALLGIAGLVPVLCPDGRLFGVLATNEPHNLFHLATGALGVVMSLGTRGFARRYFRIVGVVYGLIAVMGFLEGGRGMLLGMSMNGPDNVLDLAVAVISLAIGFLGADTTGDRNPASA